MKNGDAFASPFFCLLLLRHVFPIAARHVVELFAGIHALTDADGLEICAPKVLHQTVVAAEDVIVEFAVGKAERQRSLILERYAHGIGRAVVMVAIMPFGIVDEPRLVVESVVEMVDDERQDIMVGRNDGKICPVISFLKADKLLHAQLLMQHFARDIGHDEHIGVGEVA